MKAVWILERFVPAEETLNHIIELEQLAKEAETEEQRETATVLAEHMKVIHEQSPQGYWLGYVGKSSYKAFCAEAKDFMRRNKGGLLKSGVRAVKAEIKDGAHYWSGYVNGAVNDGVTRYLYATM